MPTDDRIAGLRISLLGGFRIDGEQGQTRLTSKRGAAIIAYLARCPDMTATRDKLADLLWGDSDSSRSRNSLRQTLSLLRRDFVQAGADIVEARKDTIGLKANAIALDVAEFEAGLVARSPQELEQALAVYRGPFLDGFHLGISTFDDWAAGERDRLQNRALESLEKLVRLVDVETGLALADRLLAMEPTREASYRLTIELLAASGQRDRAMRTFETCRTMLKKEFGVGVSPETRALWQSILSSDDAAPASVYPTSAEGVPAGKRLGRPSISVADFVNLTGERGDDYFARGLVQDIATALSEVSDYIVLSGSSTLERNSAGEEVKNPSALRARYVLSGSVQRSGLSSG